MAWTAKTRKGNRHNFQGFTGNKTRAMVSSLISVGSDLLNHFTVKIPTSDSGNATGTYQAFQSQSSRGSEKHGTHENRRQAAGPPWFRFQLSFDHKLPKPLEVGCRSRIPDCGGCACRCEDSDLGCVRA